MSRLPNFRYLMTLEAVVRHGSVVEASRELCITKGAVSKQLSQLEDWLGSPLFRPGRTRLRPTTGALALAEAAAQARALVARAVDGLVPEPAGPPLRLLAPATFATRWLIPRLWGLARHRGGPEVTVTPTHTGEPWADRPFDLAIRAGDPVPEGMAARPILRERLGLLARPGTVPPGTTPRRALAAGLPLVGSRTRPGELDAWLDAAGADRCHAGRARRYGHFYIALEAALAGEGAIVAPLETTSDLRRQGALVEPWPALRLDGPEYMAVIPRPSPRVDAVVSWLLDDAAGEARPAERRDGALPG